MGEIFQAKYQFVFGEYLQLVCAIGVILELSLIALRERNRRRSRPESANRVALMLLFALLLSGLDFLRGFGAIDVPELANYTPVYRPEAVWYLARALITAFCLLGFEFLERTIYRSLVARSPATAAGKVDDSFGDASQA